MGTKTPQAPEGLCLEGKKVWVEVVQNYDLGDGSLEILKVACYCLCRHRQARRQLRKTGLTLTNKKTGVVRRHPLCKIERDSHRSFIAAMRLLGLRGSAKLKQNLDFFMSDGLFKIVPGT